jgi:hypothetical protein
MCCSMQSSRVLAEQFDRRNQRSFATLTGNFQSRVDS